MPQTPTTTAPDVPAQITAALRGAATTRRAIEFLRPGSRRKVGGLWGASSGAFLTALHQGAGKGLLVITAEESDCEVLAGDLVTFGCPRPQVLKPELPESDGTLDPVRHGMRLRTLLGLRDMEHPVVLAPLQALLQAAPSPKALNRQGRSIQVGKGVDEQELLTAAEAAGMRRVPLVVAPGEISVRGDVVDIFPPTASLPLRLEVFDGELESLRTFDPASQRSIDSLDGTRLLLEPPDPDDPELNGSPLQHMHLGDMAVIWLEPLKIDERQRMLLDFDGSLRKRWQALQETLDRIPQADVSTLPSHDLDFKVLSAGSQVGSGEADPLGRIRAVRGMRGRLHIVCGGEDDRERLQEILAHHDVDLAEEGVSLSVGALSRGFALPELGQAFLSHGEFAGVPQRAATRPERPKLPSRAVASFFELGPGDLVVHAVHGIARFSGIETVERTTGDGDDAIEDHLRLTFKDEVDLLVPASKIHLVQKYVGAGGGTPHLDKLGGKGFAKRKADVAQSLFDLAAELLDVQAKRAKVTREPFPPDDLEQDFLDGFPHKDTPDQEKAWGAIQQDLAGDQPMDRLVCGDVGFGKTELALRAAFRVAIHGKQVAVLVPTTVLAEQHSDLFARRCAHLGLTVEGLHRYRTPKEKREIKARLANGTLDIVVGTHALLAKDIRIADLGLLVIDEEQRFGVRHKETLKRLRVGVDVLTLSATPIPRTLHQSLLGLRAISTLGTAPPGRQDVDTRVGPRTDHVVQEALQRELQREGQVFYLHNRVDSLEATAQHLQQLAPGARITIGHGQMTETQMEKTIRGFRRGQSDVLVCTTIVENGLDIPRANTILVERADRYGLAELHQLRGRVGRSHRQAYCLLMLDPVVPPPEDAKKRLKALEEFSHLGAGFAIAMRDLEIRGAGNLLGPQQSGHIAAVGYEMYCTLLQEAVASAQSDQKVPGHTRVTEVDVDLGLKAYLPDSFLPEPKARLELLREMDEAAAGGTEPEELEVELTDRFGRLPAPVRTLLRVFQLQHLLGHQGVRGVQKVSSDRLAVRHPPDQPLGGSWLEGFAAVRPVEAGKTFLFLHPPRGRKRRTPDNLLTLLLAALAGGGGQRASSSR